MVLEIYTGYYANLRKYLAGGCVPIGISVGTPKYLEGNTNISYLRKLAPSYALLRVDDEAEYTRRYKAEILGRLDRHDVLVDIARIIHERGGTGKAVLMCYEKPPKFCHRSLVAEWLNEGKIIDFQVREYGYTSPEPETKKEPEQLDLFRDWEPQGG